RGRRMDAPEPFVNSVVSGCGDLAEEPVHFAVGPGSEVEVVGVSRPRAVPEADAPEAVDRERLAVGASELAVRLEQLAVLLRLDPRDPAVAEITDEQFAARLAEVVSRRHREAPRRVEMAVLGDTGNQVAVRRVLVDEPTAPAGDLVLCGCVLLRVRDE